MASKVKGLTHKPKKNNWALFQALLESYITANTFWPPSWWYNITANLHKCLYLRLQQEVFVLDITDITQLPLIFFLLPASQMLSSSGHVPLTPDSLSPLLSPCESLSFVMEAKMNANYSDFVTKPLHGLSWKQHAQSKIPTPPSLKQWTSLLYSEQMLLGLPLFITNCPLQHFQYWAASGAPRITMLLKIAF